MTDERTPNSNPYSPKRRGEGDLDYLKNGLPDSDYKKVFSIPTDNGEINIVKTSTTGANNPVLQAANPMNYHPAYMNRQKASRNGGSQISTIENLDLSNKKLDQNSRVRDSTSLPLPIINHIEIRRRGPVNDFKVYNVSDYTPEFNPFSHSEFVPLDIDKDKIANEKSRSPISSSNKLPNINKKMNLTTKPKRTNTFGIDKNDRSFNINQPAKDLDLVITNTKSTYSNTCSPLTMKTGGIHNRVPTRAKRKNYEAKFENKIEEVNLLYSISSMFLDPIQDPPLKLISYEKGGQMIAVRNFDGIDSREMSTTNSFKSAARKSHLANVVRGSTTHSNWNQNPEEEEVTDKLNGSLIVGQFKKNYAHRHDTRKLSEIRRSSYTEQETEICKEIEAFAEKSYPREMNKSAEKVKPGSRNQSVDRASIMREIDSRENVLGNILNIEKVNATDIIEKKHRNNSPKPFSKHNTKVISATIRRETGISHPPIKIVKKPVDFLPKGTQNEKEVIFNTKLGLYRDFLYKINYSNCFIVKHSTNEGSEKTQPLYKYFLGPGNNSLMIRSFMKQRWWWVQGDNQDASDLNFLWTQVKVNKFIESQKPCKKNALELIEANMSSIEPSTDSGDSSEVEDSESRKSARANLRSSSSKNNGSLSQRKTDSNSKKNSASVRNLDDLRMESLGRIFNNTELNLYNSYSSNGRKMLDADDYEQLSKSKKNGMTATLSDASSLRVSNHLENNFHLGNKKGLLYNMTSYYQSQKKEVFNYLPLTFHIQNGVEDKEYLRFVEFFHKREQDIQDQKNEKGVKKLRNIWIVKPGENTNKGRGINVCNEINQIKDIIATCQTQEGPNKRTYLIQQYLDKPLLYNKRKFDIRCYVLITSVNGIYKGYWYQEGYIRTSCKEFTLKNVTNKFVHLTNDAVQKKAEDYGKFENGNKLSFGDFQRYLDSTYDGKINFENEIYPQLKTLATDAIRGSYGKIDPKRREHGFEIFGLDFMIDANLRAWLIEVNTNPDITTSSPHLIRIIPPMVENALRIALDPLFPPPNWPQSKKQNIPDSILENNKFELVFDEMQDGPALKAALQQDNTLPMDLIFEMEEEEEMDEEGNNN